MITEKIEELMKEGIIQRVTYPTPWISNLVAVPREDDVRLTLDPTFLNKVLKRPKFPMPTLQDQPPHFKNARFFTIVDAKDGFSNEADPGIARSHHILGSKGEIQIYTRPARDL